MCRLSPTLKLVRQSTRWLWFPSIFNLFYSPFATTTIVYDPKIQGTRARHYIRAYSLSSLISIDSTDTCTFHGSSNNRDWRKKSRCREHKSRTQSGLVTIVSLLKLYTHTHTHTQVTGSHEILPNFVIYHCRYIHL